ncbi:unnamed protein product [Polarella glacialis]|uniref:Uncharacterized protein n=1 Tax=Polarella glacialis TaxID=89957 RepID=A0A813EKE0_POLGL|nr:unnamed protein product [Polarella glacialis]
MALAHAISMERKLRDVKTPVAVEATCSRQHALVLCKALAKAQQLAFMTQDPERYLSCTAYITKLEHPPEDAAAGKEGDASALGVPRLLRVFVWAPDCVA